MMESDAPAPPPEVTMAKRPRPVAPARPAATVLLARDGPSGLEVFMLERHPAADFARGATVFPGGRVDPGDASAGVRARSRGAEGLGGPDAALHVAAIRETFEECGTLLARPRGGRELVPGSRLRTLAARHRENLLAGKTAFEDILASEDLELACDRLVPFAHWITPEFMSKRFDTHFFLAAAAPDHPAVHDGSESVDSLWIAPAAAEEEAAAGRRTIIFPTLMNLRKLGRSPGVNAALEAARREPVVTVLPRVERRGDHAVVRIPESAGYGLVEAPVDALRGASALPS